MNDKINIRAITLKIFSRWYYFIMVAAVVIPLAYVYVKYAPKVYQMKASILLSGDKQNDLGDKEFIKGMELFSSHTALEDEIGILKSYTLVWKAISELDFGVSYYVHKTFRTEEKYGDGPFTIKLDSTFNQIVEVPIIIQRLSEHRYRVRVSEKKVDAYNFVTTQNETRFEVVSLDTVAEADKNFHSHYVSFVLHFNDSYKEKENEEHYFVIHDLSNVVEDFQNNLTVLPISRESNIVELSLAGRIPEKSIRFLNKLLDVYLRDELYKKNQLGLRTIQFIDSQLGSVSDSLRQVEGSLESFRIKSNIQDINATAESLSKNLEKLETEKAGIEVKLKYYSYILKSLNENRFGDVVAPSTFGLEDPLLSNLLIDLSKLNQERAGLNYNAKDQNPLAEVVDLKIRNTKKTLFENVKNIIDVSSLALNELDVRINRIQKELNRLPRNERELVNIQRKFDFSDNVYNYLLEKRAEAGIAIASNTVEKTIVDRARIVGNAPVSPNRKIVYLITLFLCATMPVMLIVGRDFWHGQILTQEDLTHSTPIPLIGCVIHGSRQERHAIISQKTSPLTESFQSLRVNLQYLTLGKERSVIGFTSSVENEGKTFCAVNLAAAVAHAGKKTVLIDGDMRKPSVSRYFKLEHAKGLSNYLVGSCRIDEIIHPTYIKGFHVITSGAIPPNPLNLIGQPRMDQLIAHLKQTYDTIIIDAPPVGYVAEYIILMKYTDANIYVVRSEYTSRFQLGKINKLFEDKKVSNVSILLNDVKTSKLNGYSYGYRAYHT